MSLIGLYRKYGRLYRENKWIAQVISQIIEAKGVYGTAGFVTWMRDRLEAIGPKDADGRVTFGTLWSQRNVVLKIVATDVGDCRMETFWWHTYGAMQVAQAVQASMSIPLFFRPYPQGPNMLVDGGLLSNFPAWVFDAEIAAEQAKTGHKPPVLGFRLVREGKRPGSIANFEQYANALFTVALEGAGFLQTRLIDNLVPIPIPIPAALSATDFELTPQHRMDLFESGYAAADAVLSNPATRGRLNLP